MRSIESLESRRLLAGVTILTHGNDGDITGWVTGTATAIANRASGTSAIYILQIGLSSKNRLAVLSFKPDSGSPTIAQATSGETIIKLDWSTVSDGTYSTLQVGDVAANYLLTTHKGIPMLVDEPIHLIGHSRGASLNTEIAKDLGQRGVWVDEFTSLDPHPVNGGSNNFLGADFGDIAMYTWSNIVFADDYWRTNGDGNSLDPNGLPVTGAHTLSLNSTVQKDFIVSAHEAVPAYYYGTIDFTGFSDDEVPVNSDWYKGTKAAPARDATGFLYSLIAGGARPADGLSLAFGGTAKRVDVGQAGLQFPNVGDVKLSTKSITSGDSLSVRFTHQDRGGSATVIVSLDTDKNPFNNKVQIIGQRKYSKTTAVTASRVSADTTGVAAGSYYVQVETIDGNGQARFYYAASKLKIS